MMAYVTFGAQDIARARRFYTAFLPALGYRIETYQGDLSFIPPPQPGHPPLPEFYVKRPFDGGPATPGNGTMVAFEAASHAQVRDLHQAALDAGGRDEGPPGFRDGYSADFYVGYLRDPDGNKIALFATGP